MTRQQKRIGDAELDGLFVIEQRVYFKDEDKISFTTHPEFKDELSTTETLAHVGKTGIVTNAGTVTWSTAAAVAVANWGVAADGSYDYAVQKLSNDWWKVVKQQLVGSNRLTAPTGNLLARRPYALAKEEIHSHITPVVGDVLFYVTVNRPASDPPAHPAWGTALGGSTSYASSHKLCYIKQADPEGQYFQYYYAAERASQDDYNFEVTEKELAGQKFNAVNRTYIILREGWDEDAPAMGSAMPRDPDTRFPTGYVLVGREQRRIGEQELDSLYVVEVRTYAAFFDVDQEDYNYELTATEIAGQKFNAVKRTYVALRSSWSEASPAMGAAMSRDPDNKFPTGYVLVGRDQKLIGIPELDSLYVIEVRTYAAFFDVNQDSYNYSFSQADLGGNKYDTVARAYVLLRSAFDDTDTSHEAGDAMPDAADLFNDNYILLTRQQKEIGIPELDSLYVIEQRVYFNRQDIITQSLDAATGGVLKTVVALFYRGEAGAQTGSSTIVETAAATASNWGLSTAGINEEIEQLSHDWWKVTRQDVIPQGIVGTTYGGKLLRTFITYQNFSWPPVIDGLVFTTANKKDGSSKTVVTVRNKEGKDGFSGPTKMVVQQVWNKSDVEIPDPVVFKTASGVYDGVQFRVRISNSLTGAITLTDFIGTKDPVYKLGSYGFPKPWLKASDPTDWPATHVGASTQKPFRGGYLLEVITVHEPA